VICIAVDQARLVPPTTETESAFLKTYTPSAVIDRFKVAAFSEDGGLHHRYERRAA
jgi:hypothetical protein